jgi:hypothetical protein
MTPQERFIEQAIPHETGHILVGRVVGIPIYGLDHIVIRGPNKEVVAGNFATKTVSPRPDAIPLTPATVLEAYVSMIGGGLAGNIITKIAADEHGLEKDRADLRVVSPKTLEQAAEQAMQIIEDNMNAFDLLREAIMSSYTSLMKDPGPEAGRYTLLTSRALEQICPQNKTLFPGIAYR